jgi:hypothetical protein
MDGWLSVCECRLGVDLLNPKRLAHFKLQNAQAAAAARALQFESRDRVMLECSLHFCVPLSACALARHPRRTLFVLMLFSSANGSAACNQCDDKKFLEFVHGLLKRGSSVPWPCSWLEIGMGDKRVCVHDFHRREAAEGENWKAAGINFYIRFNYYRKSKVISNEH